MRSKNKRGGERKQASRVAPEVEARTTAERNRSKHAGRKASVKLEGSSGAPSRKSTRRSQNRQKAATNLQRREVRAERAPQNRARKAQARAR